VIDDSTTNSTNPYTIFIFIFIIIIIIFIIIMMKKMICNCDSYSTYTLYCTVLYVLLKIIPEGEKNLVCEDLVT
jgi:hypothetical protein